MRALDGRTGRQLWVFETNSDGCYSSPALFGDTLYIGSEGKNEKSHLFAIEARTGKLRWSYATNGKIFSTPAVSEGIVYFHARDDHIYALDTADGSLAWKTKAPFHQDPSQVLRDLSKSSTAVAHGSIYVGVGTAMKCLNKGTGRVKWRTHTKGKVDSSPVVCGDTIYIGSDDRHVYAFSADDGKELWRYKTGGRVSASPALGEGLVVIGSNDGILYAFGEDAVD